MKRVLVVFALAATMLVARANETGLVTRPSKYSVPETAARLVAAVEASNVYKVFYQLDHAANAQEAGAGKLAPSHLVLFGNPKGGAPLIADAPTLALDLPNRALIWQDKEGKVWVTYNDIASTFDRHGLKRTPDQIKAIEARQAALFDKAID